MHNEDYVAVGGKITDTVRAEVASELRDRLPSSKSVTAEHSKMKYTGNRENNVVNWITEDGKSGLQIEMTPVVVYRYRKRVAHALVDVYSDLLRS